MVEEEEWIINAREEISRVCADALVAGSVHAEEAIAEAALELRLHGGDAVRGRAGGQVEKFSAVNQVVGARERKSRRRQRGL